MDFYSDWQEWDGDGFPSEFTNSAIYFSYGEIDLDHNWAERSLARTLKDDGVADSVSDAIDLLADAVVTHGLLVEINGERFPFYGEEDEADEGNTFTATWVEVDLDD